MREFLADLRLLLGLRLRLAWNEFWVRPLRPRLSLLGFALLLTTSVGGMATAFGYGLGLLAAGWPATHLDSLVPGLTLSAGALFCLGTSFGAALGSLFLSGDLDQLMAAPVDRRAVLLAKLADGLSWSYTLLGITAAPLLIAFGLGAGLSPSFYVALALALAATPLIPAAAGALLVMLVTQLAPARRVREAVGLFAALAGLGFSAAAQTVRFWLRGLLEALREGAAADRLLDPLLHSPVPTLVAGRSLVAAGRGQVAESARGLGLYVALTGVLCIALVLAADALYAGGWMRLQEVARPARPSGAPAGADWLCRAPVPLAVALKEWRLLRRDLRNLDQVLGVLVLLPILYLNLFAGDRPDRSRGWPADAVSRATGGLLPASGVDAGAVLACGAIVAATVLLFSDIAVTGVSREGKSWWLVRVSPASALDVLGGKLLAAYLPYAALTTVLLAGTGIWRHNSVSGIAYGWIGAQILGAALLALYVATGAWWARLDWQTPRQMRSRIASSLGAAAVAVLGAAGGGLLCVPVVAEAASPRLAGMLWILAPAAAAALCGLVAGGALRLAAGGVERLTEAD